MLNRLFFFTLILFSGAAIPMQNDNTVSYSSTQELNYTDKSDNNSDAYLEFLKSIHILEDREIN